jgi:hypothetical protein
MVIKDDHTRMS